MPFDQLNIINEQANFIKFSFGSSFFRKAGSLFYLSFLLIWGIFVLYAVSKFGTIAIGTGGVILSVLGIAAIFALTTSLKELKRIFTSHIIELTDSHLYYSEYFIYKILNKKNIYISNIQYETIMHDKSRDLLLYNAKTGEELLLKNMRQEDQDVIIHQIEAFKKKLGD